MLHSTFILPVRLNEVNHQYTKSIVMIIDRIFTSKSGSPQSPMVQEGTPNLNVTLKGYPKKFWGLLDKVAHKTQQMTQFNPKRGGLSLTLTGQPQM